MSVHHMRKEPKENFIKWFENWYKVNTISGNAKKIDELKRNIGLLNSQIFNNLTQIGRNKGIEYTQTNLELNAYNAGYQKQIIKNKELLKNLEKVTQQVLPDLLLLGTESHHHLRKHKKIVSFKINNNNLEVLTSNIVNKHSRFGRYQIIMKINNKIPVINNLDWQYMHNNDNFGHPHIKNGSPCLDQYGAEAYRLELKGNLFGYVNNLIEFLSESDGINSPYVQRSDWLTNRQKIGKSSSVFETAYSINEYINSVQNIVTTGILFDSRISAFTPNETNAINARRLFSDEDNMPF